MTEEWREVEGTAGLYEVSNLGQVRSWNRPGQSAGTRSPRGPRILKGKRDRKGYWIQQISFPDGRRKFPRVHGLVAAAFLGCRPDGMETRHLDGNQNNNRLDNLKYGTVQENRDDRLRHGRIPKGTGHSGAKFDAEDIRAIRAEPMRPFLVRDLAERYGVYHTAIHKIRQCKTYKDVE